VGEVTRSKWQENDGKEGGTGVSKEQAKTRQLVVTASLCILLLHTLGEAKEKT